MNLIDNYLDDLQTEGLVDKLKCKRMKISLATGIKDLANMKVNGGMDPHQIKSQAQFVERVKKRVKKLCGGNVSEWGGINVAKEKVKPGYEIVIKASELAHKADRKCQAKPNSDMVKCRCKGLKEAISYLLHAATTKKCKTDANCMTNVRKNLQNTAQLYAQHCKKKVSEAGFEKKPDGWDDNSVKKYTKTFSSRMKGTAKSKDFFDKCVKKMQGKLDNPEGFCASLKDEAHGSTFWRGKGKKPAEVKKDVARNKNV